jgi:hypothetical protein
MNKEEIIERIKFINRYTSFIEEDMKKRLDYNVLRCLIRDLVKELEAVK